MMYGKIFDSIYDGTLAEDWRALITFQQLIVLCDADGTVDMTPESISRRTGIPLEHIKAGIEILQDPDPFSRTPDDEGCRIKLLDEHRPWGWYIVNHRKYKNLQDANTVREQNKERKRKQRAKEKETLNDGHATSQNVTARTSMSLHTDTNTDIKPSISETEIIGLISDDYKPEQNFIDRMHIAGITKTVIEEQTPLFIAHHQAKKTTSADWEPQFKLWLTRGKVNGWNTKKNTARKNNDGKSAGDIAREKIQEARDKATSNNIFSNFNIIEHE